MANQIPIKYVLNGLSEFNVGDTVPIEHGGTGSTDAVQARAALGVMSAQEVTTAISAGGGSSSGNPGWSTLYTAFSCAHSEDDDHEYNYPRDNYLHNGFRLPLFEERDGIHTSFITPLDYELGTNAFINVHWMPYKNLLPGDEVEWEVKMIVAGNNEQTSGTIETVVLSYIASGTEKAGQHIVSDSNAYQGINLDSLNALTLMKVELEDIKVSNKKNRKVFGVGVSIVYKSDGIIPTSPNTPFTKESLIV